MPAVSTGIPSCAANPDPARPIRLGWSLSSSWSEPVCVWSFSIPILTTSAWRRCATLPSQLSLPQYAAAARGVSVWQNDPGAEHPLQLQLRDIDAASQAAVLGLDPIRDRGEYAALHGILAGSEKGRAAVGDLEALLSSDNPDTRQLGLRAANLGVLTGRSGVAAAEGHWSRSWKSQPRAAWSSTWVHSTPSMSSGSSPKLCSPRYGVTGRAVSHA